MSSEKKGMMSSIFSIEDQFTFYSSYHDNIVNKVIHIMCVWPILWTAMALFASTGTSPPPQWVVEYFPFNQEAWNLHAGTPGVLVYIFFYCVMDPIGGGLAALLVIACYITSNLWIVGGGSAAVAGAVHVASWIAQLYGHGVWEGRSPALLDNVFQALLGAPLFVLFEILFFLGYRPKLHAKIKERTARNIAEYRATKKTREAKKQ